MSSRSFLPAVVLAVFTIGGQGAARATAVPASSPRLVTGPRPIEGGPVGGAAKAAGDTVLVMGPWGSGAPANGQFQSPTGAPDWNGWSGLDVTVPPPPHWHADTHSALAGSWSAWCGDASYPSCYEGEPAGGYGNDWDDSLEWRGTVADPGQPCTVDVSALVRVDTEPAYDYAYVIAVRAGGDIDLWTGTGAVGPETITLQTVYQPADYVGDAGDEVAIRFRVVSDAGWSDGDCIFPSDGAFYVDDLAIGLDNGTGTSLDFEDGTLGDLAPVIGPGVGDFAAVWSGLETRMTCARPNESPMVAFIDDGQVVPGTGGTSCISYCYGPGGYIVNTTGGQLGTDFHLYDAVQSPPLPWPGPDYDGGRLSFDVWLDDPEIGGNQPGIGYTWGVRYTTDPDSATLAFEPWTDGPSIYIGGTEWRRHSEDISSRLAANATWVQVRVAAYEYGWLYGIVGDDGTPSPYFDNVRLAAYRAVGPRILVDEQALAQDAFPAAGVIDPVDLWNNSVRFDAAVDTALQDTTVNVAEDSIHIQVLIRRPGASELDPPQLHWRLKRNPLFDPYRTAGLPDAGSVDGVWGNQGYALDLPDEGFLFPGDVLHYYFTATTLLGGVFETAILPADTTGFGDFSDPLAYDPRFTMRALPSLTETVPGAAAQPSILVWDDTGGYYGRPEWFTTLSNLGLIPGRDYDLFTTRAPYSAVGQGLGGRTALATVSGYGTILYFSGPLTGNTLGDGAAPFGGNVDDSRDVQFLAAWLGLGDRNLFLCGDDLAGDLTRGGGARLAFLQDWMGADLAGEDLMSLLGSAVEVSVAAAPAPVFQQTPLWRVTADCEPTSPGFNSTATLAGRDAVIPRAGAVRLAEFTDANGTLGVYPYSAATLNVRADVNARVISLPYDLADVRTEGGAKAAASLAARSKLLQDVLTYFGAGGGQPSGVPDAGVLAVACYPNPFNPATTVRWNLPRAEAMTLQVYDLRGRRVRTLVDAPQPAGPGEVRWDGRGDDGRAAAAGVYFYHLRAGDEARVGKMALIK